MARNTKWTANDMKYLQDNYAKMSNQQLSKVLGRSEQSIMSQGNKFGLRKEATAAGITKDELKIDHIAAMQDEHEMMGKILDALSQCKTPEWLKTLMKMSEKAHKIVDITRVRTFSGVKCH